MPKIIRVATIPLAFKNLLKGQLNYMGKNGFNIIAVSSDGKDIESIKKEENCSYLIVPMTRKITPLKDLLSLYKLIKLFIKEKPDIVHTHTPKAGLLGMMAAKIAAVKIRIHTVAGLPLMVEKGAKKKLLIFIERITGFCATNVWPNSNSLLDYIEQEKLVISKKLKVISKGSSNGVNIKKFNIEPLKPEEKVNIFKKIDHHFDEKNYYLLFIGRLVKDKGITELVESFRNLLNKKKGIYLMLVGDFEQELDPLPQHICDEIINNKNILFFGWQNEVSIFYKLANLFVFPSHREGFPNVLLQAGACGVPIACSKIEGNSDIVENECGLFFEKENAQSLHDALLFMIENKDYCKLVSSNLYLKIHSCFTNEIIWKEIKNNYLKLLQK